jgi:hypothetical protein
MTAAEGPLTQVTEDENFAGAWKKPPSKTTIQPPASDSAPKAKTESFKAMVGGGEFIPVP